MKWNPVSENPPRCDWYIVWGMNKFGSGYWTAAMFYKAQGDWEDSVWSKIEDESYSITHWMEGPGGPTI